MGRCSICDWSPDTYSLFQNSTVDGDQNRRLVKHRGEMICSTCFSGIQSTLGEFDVIDDADEALTIEEWEEAVARRMPKPEVP